MQQRYYDPVAMRFLSVDPVAASPLSFSRYWYANNNPYKNIDPDGRNPVAIVAAGCAASVACVGAAAAGAGAAVAGIEAAGNSINPMMRAAIIGVQLINGVIKNEEKSQDTDRKPEQTGNRFPDRELPRDKYGNALPEADAQGPHTQLGQKEGRNGKYDQAREFDGNGRPVKDIDFTDHGRPGQHTNPHEHPYLPNPTGGTPKRGPERPLNGGQ
jgi:hypothetical protein